MTLFSSFSGIDLFYASLTALVSVLLVIGARVFGNLPVTAPGPDFNLLTYGFLWDTTIKAVRSVEYWPRFDPHWPINKGSMLLLIFLVNVVFLAWNLKLAAKIESLQSSTQRNYLDWFLKPWSLALGVTSLIVFLFANSVWG